jgi:MFS family permease
MGVATFAIALVPTYEKIGIWGGVILTALRFLQGIGVGGQWGGAVLLAMEWTKGHHNRGFIASWPQFGVPIGLFLANLVVLAVSQMTGADFLTYGWRIPFALSLILVGVGLYIQLSIEETPTFRKLQAENKIEKAPVREVIKRQPKEIVLSAFLRMVEQAPYYIFTTFVLAYGTQQLKIDRNFLLTAVLAAAAGDFLWIPLSGWLSDKIGRRRMYLIGTVTVAVFGVVYFALLNTGIPALIFIAIMFSLLPHGMVYGPQAAMIAESFTGRLRYSGSSLGYQLASVIAGGPAPLIATALFAEYNSAYAISAYIVFCAVCSFVAAMLLPDRSKADITKEYDV